MKVRFLANPGMKKERIIFVTRSGQQVNFIGSRPYLRRKVVEFVTDEK